MAEDGQEACLRARGQSRGALLLALRILLERLLDLAFDL
jgi:hypothetical protein